MFGSVIICFFKLLFFEIYNNNNNKKILILKNKKIFFLYIKTKNNLFSMIRISKDSLEIYKNDIFLFNIKIIFFYFFENLILILVYQNN
jgi:hypothetical protein